MESNALHLVKREGKDQLVLTYLYWISVLCISIILQYLDALQITKLENICCPCVAVQVLEKWQW